MKNGKKIGVVIPAFKVKNHVYNVVTSIPEFVDVIAVVDDACPDGSLDALMSLTDTRLHQIHHPHNMGVGGAVMTGYAHCIKSNCDIVVKLDGDGQMDCRYLEPLIAPLINTECHYTKGNRFRDFSQLRSMPKLRLFGNSILSFVIKLVSGYWHVMDPTNGYTAILTSKLKELNFTKIAKGYFFETDMLINLNITQSIVLDVPIPANYGLESSSMRIHKIIVHFPRKLLTGLLKRIWLRYFIFDFNMASVYLLLSLPLLAFGFGFGLWRWYLGVAHNAQNPVGTVMIATLPIILGSQYLIAAINIDMQKSSSKF